MNKPIFIDTPIKEIGKVITGKTPATAISDNYGKDYMFITPNELHGGYIIRKSEKGLSELGLSSIKNNSISGISILVGCIGWDMGNVALCTETCATNQQINAITEVKSKYNPYYVYYWLSTKKDYLFKMASVTRTPILNKSTFEEIKIPMPSKIVQDRVVAVLSAIDRKIELNKKIINELESMVKTIYDYWFVQFEFPNEEGKPYKSSGGEMVWNGQLKRNIPKNWETKRIGDLLDKVPHSKRVQASDYRTSGEIPIIDQSRDFIAGYTNDIESLISLSNGAIIFGDHTRIVKYVGFNFARGADGTQILLSNCGKVPQLLFYYSILKFDLSNYGYARHFKFLKDLEIIIPDERTATIFNEFAIPVHKTITNKIFENLELTKKRDWLLPMLLNGQVTVE